MARSACGALLGLGALLASAPALARGPELAHLHVEANEGGSSGGHAALRVGERTYHFQHHAGGWLRLERDEAADFLFEYGVLGNRAIHERRLAASEQVAERLRDAFEARFWIEQAQFALLAALRAERELLEAIARARAGGPPPRLELPAAGYLAWDDGEAREAVPPAPSPGLARVRERVLGRSGAGFLDARAARLRAELRELRPQPRSPALLEVHGDRPPAETGSFGVRALELESGALALELLLTNATPRADAFLAPRDPRFALGEPERAALARYATRLEASLAELAASQRPDFGTALLVGMARLVALERTLESGRLVALDAFPADAPRVDRAVLARAREALPVFAAQAERELREAALHLAAREEPGEADYAALESAANRLHELLRAAEAGADLRLHAGPLVPARGARLPTQAGARFADAELPQLLARARADERGFEARLRAHAGYDLLARNCATEILRVVLEGLAPGADPEAQRKASTEALGGSVDAAGPGHFIPFVSAGAAARAWSVSKSVDRPSYRSVRLASLSRDEPGLWPRLRESNALTATIAARGPADSFYAFYTDGAPLLRPLLGLLNLGAAAGASAVGVALAPFDAGRLLGAGLRGMLWSAPELAFVSLRKGTLALALPEDPAARRVVEGDVAGGG
jgi:hypothetical protein